MIKRLEVKSCLGIKQFEANVGKVNIIRGGNEKGKTSLLDIIRKGFENTTNRAEFVKDGEDEAFLLLELDDGLEIERRERPDGRGSIKLTRDGAKIPRPETFLKSLVGNFSFNPVEFFQLKDKEQTEVLLSLIPLEVKESDLKKWFGEVAPVNLNQHAIHVLEYLAENYYYDKRTIANSEVKETTNEINALFQQLPDNYNGDTWREVNIGDLWKSVEKGTQVNVNRQEAQRVIEEKDAALQGIKNRYDLKRKDAEEYCQFRTQKIKDGIAESKEEIRAKIEKEKQYTETLKGNIRQDIEEKKEQIRKLQEQIKTLENGLTAVDKDLESNIKVLEKDLSMVDESAESKIQGLEEDKVRVLQVVDEQEAEAKNHIENRIKNAQEYLDKNPAVDIEPLKAKAEKAETMKGFIPLYDNMVRLQETLKDKKAVAQKLDENVALARKLPAELLKTVKMPVKGLGINDKMQLTIDGLPISNLSTGRQIKLAWDIARATSNPKMPLVCIDRFESLDPENQKLALEEMASDNFQYFVTIVSPGDLKMETQGSLF